MDNADERQWSLFLRFGLTDVFIPQTKRCSSQYGRLSCRGQNHRTIAAMVASTPRPKKVYSRPCHNFVSNGTGSAKNRSIASCKNTVTQTDDNWQSQSLDTVKTVHEEASYDSNLINESTISRADTLLQSVNFENLTNSSLFSALNCLQYTDTAGWASGRASNT